MKCGEVHLSSRRSSGHDSEILTSAISSWSTLLNLQRSSHDLDIGAVLRLSMINPFHATGVGLVQLHREAGEERREDESHL